MNVGTGRPQLDDNWCIIEESFDIRKNRHYESLFTLGTGYVSTRGSIEEGFENDDQAMDYVRLPGVVTLEKIPAAKSRWGTYMPAIGGKHPFLLVGVVNLPYYLGLSISADGDVLNLEDSKIEDYCRWLDMKTATLYRTLTWRTVFGNKIRLLFTRFMDTEQRFVCVQECRIEMLEGSSDVSVTSFIDNDVRTNGYDKYVERCVDRTPKGLLYSDITTNMNTRVVTAGKMIIDQATEYPITRHARRIQETGSFVLKQGETATVKKASAVIADRYFPEDDLIRVASEMIARNLEEDTEALHRKHVEFWARRWDVSDIEIDAEDPEGYNSQRAIRMAVHHLLRARAEGENQGQTCPKCNTSDVYFGGTFWDMEVFIVPFYLYTNPKAAGTTAMFRYLNLPEARKIAKRHGYEGARYPWTSAYNGTETCPMWEFAEHQVHITADVALGIWHHFLISGDEELFFNYGAEVIIETARYWTGRVDRLPGKEGYQILGVMGPDEYKPITNNNAYTNQFARFNLEVGAKTIDLLKKKAPEKFRELAERISLKEEEADRFREIASGISVPIDPERQIVWQCDDFDTAFADINPDKVWKDRTKPFGLFVSQEKRFRSKFLKQSDTTAMLAVFPASYTREQKEASFDYYSPITSHDSSNSMCLHMILAANIGRAETAYECWKRSMDIDFGRLPRSSDGLHGANVGGMWQEIVFGFAGVASALNADILTLNPCMPKAFKKLSFKLLWKGIRTKITITKRQVSVENLSRKVLSVKVKNKEHKIKARRQLKVST